MSKQYTAHEVVGEAADFPETIGDMDAILLHIRTQIEAHLAKGDGHWVNVDFSNDGICEHCTTISNNW